MDFNLSEAAILNESQGAETVGDVTLFREIESLAGWTERIDVKNREYFAYTLAGHRLELRVEDERVTIAKVGNETR